MGSSFTVFFEGPFWVGILEIEASAGDGGYRVARKVFGAEPGNAELLAFMLDAFHLLLQEGNPRDAPSGSPGPGAKNPKRAQREARRDLGRSTSTRAQAALSASREEGRAEAKACRREALSAAEARRFRLRSEKKKGRHRGH